MEGQLAAFRLRAVFCAGALLSPCWFFVQFWLTSVHEIDADIINHAGMLRYHTQNIGVKFCMRNLETATNSPHQLDYHVDTEVNSFTKLHSIINGLQGTRQVEGVPEALDEEVKDALRDLGGEINRIQSLEGNVSLLEMEEMREVIFGINKATLSIDGLVRLASARAEYRVHELLMINVLRATMSVIWAMVSMVIVGKIWKHYFEAHLELSRVLKMHTALLSSMFDVVVPVSVTGDFQVLEHCKKFEHIAGRQMKAQSIFQCCWDDDAKHELQRLFDSAKSYEPASEESSRSSRCLEWMRERWWWKLVPAGDDEKPIHVAPMIRTSWAFGQDELRREVPLEVMVTPCIKQPVHTAFLAFRLLTGPTEIPQPAVENLAAGLATNESVHQSITFPAAALPDRAAFENISDGTAERAEHLSVDDEALPDFDHLRININAMGSTGARSSHSLASQSTGRDSNRPMSVESTDLTPPPTVFGHPVGHFGGGAPSNASNRNPPQNVFAEALAQRLAEEGRQSPEGRLTL
eukprot:TRINITY_DN5370_c0_g2_i1.p1 TRINITY_DN5370_c0_g2~~TRINITY_DN5370_c0_g2_i1.p1  ORF type:complete len:522 (-),score=76.58 TRINITY_DN5370_c0_g2_i1:162-1727(-)